MQEESTEVSDTLNIQSLEFLKKLFLKISQSIHLEYLYKTVMTNRHVKYQYKIKLELYACINKYTINFLNFLIF